MIELKVEPYCQNCPDFEADVDHNNLYHYDMINMETISISETVVTCTKAHRCANLVRYLKKEIEKNANVST